MDNPEDELAPAYVVLKAGYDLGVEEERERILNVLQEKAEARTIFEALAYPFLFEELKAAIMEGQDD